MLSNSYALFDEGRYSPLHTNWGGGVHHTQTFVGLVCRTQKCVCVCGGRREGVGRVTHLQARLSDFGHPPRDVFGTFPNFARTVYPK